MNKKFIKTAAFALVFGMIFTGDASYCENTPSVINVSAVGLPEDSVDMSDIIASGRGWTLTKDGTLTVDGDCDIWEWNADNAADNYDDVYDIRSYYHVEDDGKHYFGLSDKIINVVITKNVTEIKRYSFIGCKNLKSVTIADGVEKIGISAFANCTSLKSADIPDSVKKIEFAAFYNCTSLENITLPDGLGEISNILFYNCTSLEEIIIPESVKSIATAAFENCTALKEINIPQNVSNIQDSAFVGCSSLKSINVADGNKRFISDRGALYYESINALLAVPGGYEGTFDVREGTLQIFEYAFNYCDKITRINIPADTVSIIDGAFCHCAALEKIAVHRDNENFRSYKGMLFSADRSVLRAVPGGIAGTPEIPAGTKCIGSRAFYGCDKITEVTFPKSLDVIDKLAFNECTGLKKIAIPENVYVGDYAFYGCTSLEEVIFPDTFREINEFVFDNCTSLKKIDLPKGLERIGRWAFSRCSSLKSVTVPEKVTIIDSDAFSSCDSLESVTIIGNPEIKTDSFAFCGSLTRVTVNGSPEIQEYAFLACENLIDVYVNGNPRIDEKAFTECSRLNTSELEKYYFNKGEK